MSGEEGRQVCSFCTLIIQASVPPCTLPASYKGLTSAAQDPVFAVDQVVAATIQRAGGFTGVSPPQPVLYCTLLSPSAYMFSLHYFGYK